MYTQHKLIWSHTQVMIIYQWFHSKQNHLQHKYMYSYNQMILQASYSKINTNYLYENSVQVYLLVSDTTYKKPIGLGINIYVHSEYNCQYELLKYLCVSLNF